MLLCKYNQPLTTLLPSSLCSNLQRSLELADMVADENLRLYDEFSQEQMGQLLLQFRKAHIAVMKAKASA